MTNVEEQSQNTVDDIADLPETVKARRARRDRRIAEIRARHSEIKVEPSPGLKELVDSQDEFRDRVRSSVRLATGA
jgi:hypothetical protein